MTEIMRLTSSIWLLKMGIFKISMICISKMHKITIRSHLVLIKSKINVVRLSSLELVAIKYQKADSEVFLGKVKLFAALLQLFKSKSCI